MLIINSTLTLFYNIEIMLNQYIIIFLFSRVNFLNKFIYLIYSNYLGQNQFIIINYILFKKDLDGDLKTKI